MPQLEREIVDRALRWCAESGRPVREDLVRRTLEPLGWDELLAVKAVLADPPPGSDLSPADLLALARGTVVPAAATKLPRASRRAPARESRTARGPSGPRIRRVRDRVEAVPSSPAALPPIELLFQEAGRSTLGRMVRRRGANRAGLLGELAAGWAAGSAPPSDADLDRLLAHHGMARGFAERERALLLHAFRKFGGVTPRVARALGAQVADLRAAIARLELGAAIEAIRDARRKGLDRKGTLAERARLLDEEEETLADLGLLPGFEADLRRRLPEHLRALAGGGRPPSAADLGRSLSLSRSAVDRLVARFTLPLRPAPPERPGRREGRPPRPGAPRPGAPRPGAPRPGAPGARRPRRT